MKLNIAIRILLNGILSVVISVTLVTLVISFIWWDRSEKQARQKIRHTARVIGIRLDEMKNDMKDIALKIGNQQEYASKAGFIQDNRSNRAMGEMLDVEKRELTLALYELALNSRFNLLLLWNAQGERMCSVKIRGDRAYLSYTSNREQGTEKNAAVVLGTFPRSEDWLIVPDSRNSCKKQSVSVPLVVETDIRRCEGHLCLTAAAPLSVEVFNPRTMREEAVPKGGVAVSRYLDDDFVRRICDLTDTRINLFADTVFSAGNVNSHRALDEKLMSAFGFSDAGPVDTSQIAYGKRHIVEGTFFEGVAPLMAKDRVIGAFSVLLSQEETREAQWGMIRSLVVAALMCILIVIPLTWFLALREIIERDRMRKELAMHRNHLEELVAARTEELAAANRELDRKNIRLNETLEEVETAHREITQSISYARTIQRSLISGLEGMKKEYLPRSFFIWEPCEIVSGDIFHADFFEDGMVIGVIDCTGHGVPGAFMTMLAFSAMRRITRTEQCHDPAEILRRLNHTVKLTLHQDRDDTISNDGMDAAICFVRSGSPLSGKSGDQPPAARNQKPATRNQPPETRNQKPETRNQKPATLTFAGAKLSLYCVRNGELEMIKGDKQSIGYKDSDLDFEFRNHTVGIESGMSFYMASDGITDQPGGEKGLRLGNSRFRKMLTQIAHLPFDEQRRIILERFEEYRGENERVDDVTAVGFGFG